MRVERRTAKRACRHALPEPGAAGIRARPFSTFLWFVSDPDAGARHFLRDAAIGMSLMRWSQRAARPRRADFLRRRAAGPTLLTRLACDLTAHVDTSLWGGVLVTIVGRGSASVFLADRICWLGRRSNMPAVSCLGDLHEFVRACADHLLFMARDASAVRALCVSRTSLARA